MLREATLRVTWIDDFDNTVSVKGTRTLDLPNWGKVQYLKQEVVSFLNGLKDSGMAVGRILRVDASTGRDGNFRPRGECLREFIERNFDEDFTVAF